MIEVYRTELEPKILSLAPKKGDHTVRKILKKMEEEIKEEPYKKSGNTLVPTLCTNTCYFNTYYFDIENYSRMRHIVATT